MRLSITIPTSVTSIGDDAFYGCSALISATILNPDCIIGTYDKYYVFWTCPSSLVIKGWEGSTAEAYAQAIERTFEALVVPAPTFNLPSNLTTIEADAFSGIAAEAVRIPATVTSITGNPFAGENVRYIYGLTELVRNFAENNGYIFVPVEE